MMVSMCRRRSRGVLSGWTTFSTHTACMSPPSCGVYHTTVLLSGLYLAGLPVTLKT